MNKENGITLVALVISIIVLLILATVSISLVINNGILDKAKYAVDKYSEGEIEEQIKLSMFSIKIKNKEINEENLTQELQSVFNNNKEVKKVDNYYTYSGYRINEDGSVEKWIPDNYQELEYIESSGTQYIVINDFPTIELSQSTNVEIDIKLCIKSGFYAFCSGVFYSDCFLGLKNEHNGSLYYLKQYSENNAYLNTISTINIIDNGTNIIINYNDGQRTFNRESSTFSTNYPLCLFNRLKDGTGEVDTPFATSAQLYSFSVKNNGRYLYRLVPCLNSLNEAGLYNTVDGMFYKNQGSGAFSYQVKD